MIDLTVPVIRIELKNIFTREYSAPELPAGYTIQTYRDGMEQDWVRIMRSVGFFKSDDEARKCFTDTFLTDAEAARRHVFFVVREDGTAVGSCSCWFEKGFHKVHWLAVLPEEQRNHLGFVLVRQCVYTFQQEGINPVYLDTQTSSHRAICLYLKEGFLPMRRSRFTGEPLPDYQKILEILQEKMPPKYFELYQANTIDE